MAFLMCFCSVIPVKAASKSTTKQWATAYMKIIKKANKEDKARKKRAYFDNDMAGAIQYLYYGKMKNHKIVDRNSKSLYIYNFNDKTKMDFLIQTN